MNLKGISEKRKKQLLMITAVIAVVSMLVVSVSARYIRKSNEAINNFSPAHSVQPTINEDFDEVIKEKVSISVGDTEYPVYVRIALIFTWKMEKQTEADDGYLSFVKPKEGEDYTIEFFTDNNWYYSDPDEGGDGYYYYTKPVASGGTTEQLIKSCEQLKNYVDEQEYKYTLNLEVITQTVQAVGHTDEGYVNGVIMAVEDAWNWKPAD